MDSALRALCSTIQSGSDLTAGVGHPDDVDADVVLWPWRIFPAQLVGPVPPRQPDESPARPPAHRVELSFLVLSPNSLSNLIRASRCAFENPMVQVDGARYALREQPLYEDLQVALLAAAGIRMQPVVNYLVVEVPRDN